MTRLGNGAPHRLGAFAAMARRVSWSMPRAQRTLIWQRLQTKRATPRPDVRRSLASLLGRARNALTLRSLLLASAAVVLLISAGRTIAHNSRVVPWHHDVQLVGSGPATSASEGEVLALNQLQGPGDVAFSDGTSLGVGATSRVVVDAMTSEGASIRLVRGSVDAHVRPRKNARWMFGAGPFRVDVKGTSFRLNWQPETDRMTLKMWSGVVVVRGGKMRNSMTVSAGESIVLTGSGDVSLAPGAMGNPPPEDEASHPAEGPPPSAPLPRALGDEAPPAMRRLGSASHDRRGGRELVSSRESWPALVARGEFTEIVAQARRRGIESTLARGSDSDIAAFADAARYTRQNQLARDALLALRSRFPGSERAKSGAFFLGRLGESTDGDVETALTWYDRYLQESPHGGYVEGAMAREMVLLRHHKARGRAKAMAQRYLNEYPEGTYRDLAGRLSGAEVR